VTATLGPGDRGYNPPVESMLRAIRGEARRDERIRIHDALSLARQSADSEPRTTTVGRRVDGLDVALTLVGIADWFTEGPWSAEVGSVSSEIDGVEVGVYTERDDCDVADELPVRLRVFDGGDSVSACAFLTAVEARELAGLLTLAADRIDTAVLSGAGS
jgi:hypothetical protein